MFDKSTRSKQVCQLLLSLIVVLTEKYKGICDKNASGKETGFGQNSPYFDSRDKKLAFHVIHYLNQKSTKRLVCCLNTSIPCTACSTVLQF